MKSFVVVMALMLSFAVNAAGIETGASAMVKVDWRNETEVTNAVEVSATASTTDLRVTAVQRPGGGTVTLTNPTDRAIPLVVDAKGRPAHSYQLTDANRKGKYYDDSPTNLPPHSLAVVHYDWRKAMWKRPQTTRRYLQGPFAERLLVAWREGRVTLGEVLHSQDWQSCPYERQVSHGLWLLRGEQNEPLDFREAKLRLENDATPIAGESWRIGDLEIDFESCAPFGRRPNAQVRVKVTNLSAKEIEETFSFMMRTGQEKMLCTGAPDGYISYQPNISDWLRLPTNWKTDAAGVCRDGERFIAFSAPFDFDVANGVAKWKVRIRPGGTAVMDCVVGKGASESPSYDLTRGKAKFDWGRELVRAQNRPEIVRHLLVQILQCFSVPTEGDFILPRQGGLQRWIWPWDQKQASAALDMLGYGDYVEKTVSYYFDVCQQPSGEIGPFGNRWINDTASCLEVLANHALVIGDRVFWQRYRERALKALEWIDGMREGDGLFPSKNSTDAGLAFRHWGLTDVLNLLAMEKLAAAAGRFEDPMTDRVQATAASYRAAIGRQIDKWRKRYEGTDEFYLPFTMEGENDRFYQKNLYFSHPGNFAGAGFLSEDELLRMRRWMLRRGYSSEQGPYELCRSARADIACHVWYMSSSELGWFNGWRRVGRDDLAKAALMACLKYAMTDEYMVGERYHDCDEWYFPWCPNASGAGRILQMLLQKP